MATRYDSAAAADVIASFDARPELLVQILAEFVARFGFIGSEATRQIAAALNLSRADVHGVLSFYHDFRTEPPGQTVVRICQAEACQAMGSRALTRHAEELLGTGLNETSADGRITLEPVYCLGNCACSPAIMIDGRVWGRVDAARFERHWHRHSRRSVAATARQEMTMSKRTRLFVPRETAALSLGADDVATAIESMATELGVEIELVRNGSRGMSWLEPLVEVETNGQRLAYGPVAARDVPSLMEAGLLSGGKHALALGPTDELPYLKNQQRFTFARCGLIDPLSLDDYRAHGGFRGWERARAAGPAGVVEAIKHSGLRGRGGAGFPTGIKWQTVADADADQKFIACNADEGDSGTFSDRILMESDPFTLLEGMLIAGFAVGASRGYIYLRSEYPLARRVLEQALSTARAAGRLGRDIDGSGFDFDIDLHIGGGSYVCGEETSMLESLEGKAGLVRSNRHCPRSRACSANRPW